MIKRLGENKKIPRFRQGDSKAVRILGDAIKQHFSDNDTRIADLEKQVKDANINIRLSRRQKEPMRKKLYTAFVMLSLLLMNLIKC